MNALTVQNPQPQVIEKQDNNTINYICTSCFPKANTLHIHMYM